MPAASLILPQYDQQNIDGVLLQQIYSVDALLVTCSSEQDVYLRRTTELQHRTLVLVDTQSLWHCAPAYLGVSSRHGLTSFTV